MLSSEGIAEIAVDISVNAEVRRPSGLNSILGIGSSGQLPVDEEAEENGGEGGGFDSAIETCLEAMIDDLHNGVAMASGEYRNKIINTKRNSSP